MSCWFLYIYQSNIDNIKPGIYIYIYRLKLPHYISTRRWNYLEKFKSSKSTNSISSDKNRRSVWNMIREKNILNLLTEIYEYFKKKNKYICNIATGYGSYMNPYKIVCTYLHYSDQKNNNIKGWCQVSV